MLGDCLPAEFTDTVGLFYDPRINRFEDEDGFIVWSIFEIVTPNDIYLFRHNQEYMLVPHRQFKDVGVELFYPEAGDCDYCANYYECYGDDENSVIDCNGNLII